MAKKTALITESSGGLRSCCTEIYIKRGGNLVLVGRRQTKLDKQVEDLGKDTVLKYL